MRSHKLACKPIHHYNFSFFIIQKGATWGIGLDVSETRIQFQFFLFFLFWLTTSIGCRGLIILLFLSLKTDGTKLDQKAIQLDCGNLALLIAAFFFFFFLSFFLSPTVFLLSSSILFSFSFSSLRTRFSTERRGIRERESERGEKRAASSFVRVISSGAPLEQTTAQHTKEKKRKGGYRKSVFIDTMSCTVREENAIRRQYIS